MDPIISSASNQIIQAQVMVADAICNKYASAAVTPDQVKAIIQAALEQIDKNPDPALGAILLGKTPDVVVIRRVLDVVSQILVCADSPWKPKIPAVSRTQKLFLGLIQGNFPTLGNLIKEKGLLAAVIWKPNPALLKEARILIQELFTDIAAQCGEMNPKDEQAHFHMEVIIGDLLSLYPFLRQKNGEELHVPVQVHGVWKMVCYNTEHIRLTPRWMGSPMIATALNPKEDHQAPPLLLFKGTTYPTDKGFSLGLLSDFNPGASIGAYALKIGKTALQAWFNKQDLKARVFGKSLGGALGMNCALQFPAHVEKVMTISAPGFSTSDIKRWDQIYKEHPDDHPKIIMLQQAGDPVPLIDKVAISPSIQYYRVIGAKYRAGLIAHAQMAITNTHSSIIKLDPTIEANRTKRFLLTFLRAIGSPFIFTLLLVGHALTTALRRGANLLRRAWSKTPKTN